jgi:uncharacterized SAM-binding protein YcdF (DUF218 family)
MGHRGWLVVACATIVASGVVYALTPSEMAWLEVREPLERAAVIAVLNGENNRADEAAALFLEGYGHEVWLTIDPRSGSDVGGDAGTADNLRRLEAHGVPGWAVRVLPESASGTRAELRQVVRELRRRNLNRAILVTSRLHARRVRALWRCEAGDAPSAVIQSPPMSGYRGPRIVRQEVAGAALASLCLHW